MTNFSLSALVHFSMIEYKNVLFIIQNFCSCFANMDRNVGGARYYHAKHLCQFLIIMVLGGRLIWRMAVCGVGCSLSVGYTVL